MCLAHLARHLEVYNERGNFAYIVGILVDVMSNTTLEDTINDNWCLDSSVSHHKTPDIENFYDAQSYQGMTSIIIGDGKTLTVSHIGMLILKNTLCS